MDTHTLLTTKIKKIFMDNNEKEIAELILGISKPKDRKSTLQLALESANFHLGIKDDDEHKDEGPNILSFDLRNDNFNQSDDETYNIRCNDESELFTALFLYLNILEQIGLLFCKDTSEKNNTIKALKKFDSQINREERTAIKNLRNSLAHNFGLVNYNSKTNKPTHKYTIDMGDEREKVIELPTKEWDGNYADKSKETSCIIYIYPLMKHIHSIFKKAKAQYLNNELSFAIDNIEEIKSRFTIKVSSQN